MPPPPASPIVRGNTITTSRGKGPRRNKIGRLRRVAGSHRVVPLRVEAMAGDREGVDVFAGVFDAGGVLAGVKDTVDGQAGSGGGVADQVDDDLVRLQRPAAPVHGDLGEQSVLDPVPFRGSRW